MSGVVFTHTLRSNWKQVLYWGVGMALLGYYLILIIPNVDALQQYADLLKTMPPALLQLVGAEDVSALATPEGFLSTAFFSRLLLILAVLAVTLGLSVTANEEDEGIMDVMLSLPIARWRIIIEKFAAFILMCLAIVVLGLIGLMLGLGTSTMQVQTIRLVESSFNVLPSLLLLIAVTMFLGTVIRRKSLTISVTIAFIVGSFFIDFVGASASGTVAETLRGLSFFSYYDSQSVMLHGLSWSNVLILLGVTALLVVGSVIAFNRRDIGL